MISAHPGDFIFNLINPLKAEFFKHSHIPKYGVVKTSTFGDIIQPITDGLGKHRASLLSSSSVRRKVFPDFPWAESVMAQHLEMGHTVTLTAKDIGKERVLSSLTFRTEGVWEEGLAKSKEGTHKLCSNHVLTFVGYHLALVFELGKSGARIG